MALVIRVDSRTDGLFCSVMPGTDELSSPAASQQNEVELREDTRYQSLLEHLPVGVYRSTPDGCILEANQAMADLLGYDSPAALCACDVQDLYVSEAARRRHVEQLQNDQRQVAEYALYHADGSVVWVRDYPHAVKNESGKVAHYDGVLVDITEGRRAKERLEQSESRLRAVVENAADLIELIDADGAVRYVSGAAREVTGFQPQDMLGHKVFERMHPDDLPDARRKFQALLDHPSAAVEHEYRFRHKEGDWRYLSAHVRNFLGRPGIDALLATVRDVTEKKRFEQELVEAKEEAEEMARLKTTFLTNMSHEIRTPLASILGFAEVLVEEVEGEMREFAELIQQGGERLSETLDSVLDLARLEAGGFEPDFEAVSVRDVMQEAADLYAPMAEQKGLTFELDLPGEDLNLWADRAGVGRMLANLLSNAIKFTSEGKVRLEAHLTAEGVELRVSDTGAGMGEAFREHLFEAFRQESSGLARLHEGTGLGLTITRHLADVMNADIQVESEKGVGSTFTLRFRREEASLATRPRSSDQSLPDFETGQGRLLIVEDNRDTRRLLKHLLGSTWTLTVVPGPKEAIEAAEETDFSAVLVDINLGTELNGVDVMKRLRRKEHYAQAPFVALTAYAMPGDAESFTEAGFDAYLSKPFKHKELLRLLEQVIGAEGSAPPPD